jgi:hypothetical protein
MGYILVTIKTTNKMKTPYLDIEIKNLENLSLKKDLSGLSKDALEEYRAIKKFIENHSNSEELLKENNYKDLNYFLILQGLILLADEFQGDYYKQLGVDNSNQFFNKMAMIRFDLSVINKQIKLVTEIIHNNHLNYDK